MACINPPALGDDQLLLYLDREADSGVTDHISTCTYCRGRAAALANVQARLTAGLYRNDCPSPQALGDYQLKLIAADRRPAIKSHLDGCPHCTLELQELRRYLSEHDAELSISPVTRLRILVARLASGLEQTMGSSSPMPAFAGLRGEAEGPLHYEVDDFDIRLEIQPDPASPSKRTLIGLILGDILPWDTATLFIGDEKVTSERVDSLGNFVLSNLKKETYDLLLQGHEVEIHIPGLEI